MRVSLIFSLLFALFGVLLFPHVHLLYFAPYLVLVFYKYSRFTTLWHAIGCGAFIDCFSSTPYFGLTALNYCIVSWILCGQRRNFFADRFLTLPLMTFFFSVLSTLLAVILFLFFSQPVLLSLKWVFTDLICMPLLDLAYAFLISLPFQITTHLHKMVKAKRRIR